MSSESVARLRELLEKQFPGAAPITRRSTDQVATGIQMLDQALPSGGLPRGRLSVWAPQGGATAILRAACHGTVMSGERAVWVDGDHTIAGAFWIEGPLLVRPKTRRHALRAAEELLRCGGFALLVLAGVDPAGTETVRLARAAREGGSAFVALTTRVGLSSLRLASRILPHSYRWRRTPFGDPAEAQEVVVRIRARAPGWNRHAEFPVPITRHELRLSLEPELADRRGVPR